MDYTDAFIYANAIVILTAINAIVVNHFIAIGWCHGMKVRVAVCSLIYRKVNPPFYKYDTSSICLPNRSN